ncbi:hypothetical protein [Flavobacterium sp.]
MKRYAANEELITVLEKNGFVDKSSTFDKKANLKRFQPSRALLKEIVFDSQCIDVYEAGVVLESKVTVTEQQLRVLILFFHLKNFYLSELSQDLPFEFNRIMNRFANLQIELQIWTSIATKKPRIKKIEKIMEVYNAIQL